METGASDADDELSCAADSLASHTASFSASTTNVLHTYSRSQAVIP